MFSGFDTSFLPEQNCSLRDGFHLYFKCLKRFCLLLPLGGDFGVVRGKEGRGLICVVLL